MEDITYEAAIQELETILGQLQEEQVSIDQLVERSDRAAALIEYCKQKLRAVESKVEEQS
ncbi:MAG: exodeoxyribonuclease VII small subunit [Bacteroidota bacterium]